MVSFQGVGVFVSCHSFSRIRRPSALHCCHYFFPLLTHSCLSVPSKSWQNVRVWLLEGVGIVHKFAFCISSTVAPCFKKNVIVGGWCRRYQEVQMMNGKIDRSWLSNQSSLSSFALFVSSTLRLHASVGTLLTSLMSTWDFMPGTKCTLGTVSNTLWSVSLFPTRAVPAKHGSAWRKISRRWLGWKLWAQLLSDIKVSRWCFFLFFQFRQLY